MDDPRSQLFGGGRYRYADPIGQGNYGTAFIVEELETGDEFVIKRVVTEHLSPSQLQTHRSEIRLLRELDHPCVVGYADAFEERENGGLRQMTLNIVMEYCDEVDLKSKLKWAKRVNREILRINEARVEKGKRPLAPWRFPQEVIVSWIAQVASALAYCHSCNVLHRDVKPGNIFLTQHGWAKLGDFGISRKFSETTLAQTKIGTPLYLSPEQAQEIDYDGRADVWSLGCVLFELMTLQRPFTAKSPPALLLKIISDTPAPDVREVLLQQAQEFGEHSENAIVPYSQGLRKLCAAMLAKKIDDRLTAAQVCEHPLLHDVLPEHKRLPLPLRAILPKTFFVTHPSDPIDEPHSEPLPEPEVPPFAATPHGQSHMPSYDTMSDVVSPQFGGYQYHEQFQGQQQGDYIEGSQGVDLYDNVIDAASNVDMRSHRRQRSRGELLQMQEEREHLFRLMQLQQMQQQQDLSAQHLEQFGLVGQPSQDETFMSEGSNTMQATTGSASSSLGSQQTQYKEYFRHFRALSPEMRSLFMSNIASLASKMDEVGTVSNAEAESAIFELRRKFIEELSAQHNVMTDEDWELQFWKEFVQELDVVCAKITKTINNVE